ncbi:hypothetical protein [Leptolyngbya sp. 7M]|uniref:hypothetical protein n=1 Tax=Leptolyngbya sp. 7M TaxID=2812896 RepID=UPI001B8AE407|nr:hypothetical protein [Leptolyngbya sp. 7M]QYO65541.1 hypothetical protein JVX88_01770 [Leptolyngbya sp. 7M]
MSDIVSVYDIPKSELVRGSRLKAGAMSAPIILTALPAVLFTILFFLFGSAPPAAITLLFAGVISTMIGLIIGLIISGVLIVKRNKWMREIRERMAADGIKASELEWFSRELKPAEKRALREIEKRDLLLGDAYRETLASRLTATRIVKHSKRELVLMERRRAKLRSLSHERTSEFVSEIEKDIGKLRDINTEAQQMLIEAESRLQMIEAASIRGGGIADSEIALKRLNARRSELPLALEEAKLTEEIRKELEREEERMLRASKE